MHRHRYFVYMLRCSDDSFYVGITNDVERRMEEHQSGQDPQSYTHHRRPVTLVYRAEFREVTEAIAWETRLKKWSHKKKEALLKDDNNLLSKLSVCRNASHSKNCPPHKLLTPCVIPASNQRVIPSGDEP